jgi:hypothetical protein
MQRVYINSWFVIQKQMIAINDVAKLLCHYWNEDIFLNSSIKKISKGRSFFNNKTPKDAYSLTWRDKEGVTSLTHPAPVQAVIYSSTLKGSRLNSSGRYLAKNRLG